MIEITRGFDFVLLSDWSLSQLREHFLRQAGGSRKSSVCLTSFEKLVGDKPPYDVRSILPTLDRILQPDDSTSNVLIAFIMINTEPVWNQ